MSYTYTSSNGRKYYLHKFIPVTTVVTPKPGYYFASALNPVKACDSLPRTLVVEENPKTGFPVIHDKPKTVTTFVDTYQRLKGKCGLRRSQRAGSPICLLDVNHDGDHCGRKGSTRQFVWWEATV